MDGPPEGCRRIQTIDAHAGGEPLRVIVGGVPQPRGDTVLARRRDAESRLDGLRRALMWEPRGHADMYGCLLMPPVHPGSDVAVLFLHNSGFSTMCGHGIIALATVLVETGRFAPTGPETPIAIDTPAGTVHAVVVLEEGRVSEVRFRNVPAFVSALDARVDVPAIGGVSCDVAFGGAFYAFVDASAVGLELVPGRAGEIIDAGRRIRDAVAAEVPVEHPDDPDLAFLYGVIFTGPARGRHSRHACVFADGELDRSPTGTGVSARLALLAVRDGLPDREWVEIESLIGSRFRGRIVGRTRSGPHAAIVPEVAGRAWLTGRHEFWLDPHDPWAEGFLLR